MSSDEFTDSQRSRQFEDVAIAAHGMAAGVHFFGLFYHVRRKSWADAAVHGGALIYSGVSLYRHVKWRDKLHKRE